jgi:hypothetical protein
VEATLTPRALNRALLDRQMLLERSPLPLTDIVERMGGIQNQYAPAGYIGLWSRMRGFERPMLTEALEERRLIQGTMMRGTIHVVSAADYWPMMAGIARVNREWLSKAQAREIGGTDLDAVVDAVRQELADGPLRFAVLKERLAARGLPERAAGWVASAWRWCACRHPAPGSAGGRTCLAWRRIGCHPSRPPRRRGSSSSFAATSAPSGRPR